MLSFHFTILLDFFSTIEINIRDVLNYETSCGQKKRVTKQNKNTSAIERQLWPSTEETKLTVRQDSICPERIFSPSKTMSPAITALVVAIAGMIFPAMAGTSSSTSEIRALALDVQL